jgi:glycosyltransferase involved in cell wall biosynthesis
MTCSPVLLLNKNQNNGKTLLSIFKGWDPDKLAQMYFLPEIPEKEVCNNYFRITDSDVLKSIFKIGNIKKSEGEKKSAITTLQFIRNFKGPFFFLMRDLIWKFHNKDSYYLWLNNFDPEIIFYVTGTNTFSYDIALNISKKRKIPLVLYFTDDYILPRRTINPFWWLQNVRLKKRFYFALNLSSKNFVIGDSMNEEYSRRFGKDFDTLMNLVELHDIEEKKDLDKITFIVSYLGNLALGRWKALAIIAEQIKRLKEEGFKILLEVYSLQKPNAKILKLLHNPPYSVFKGAVTDQNEIDQIISRSNLVLHVESFSKKDKDVTRFSVSTKISEYLSYGKCILAYGPEDVASIKYLKRNKAALICNDSKEVYEGIRQILVNSTLKQEYMLTAYNLAKEKHSRPDMKSILNNL